jgi:hypothetical protein
MRRTIRSVVDLLRRRSAGLPEPPQPLASSEPEHRGAWVIASYITQPEVGLILKRAVEAKLGEPFEYGGATYVANPINRGVEIRDMRGKIVARKVMLRGGSR